MGQDECHSLRRQSRQHHADGRVGWRGLCPLPSPEGQWPRPAAHFAEWIGLLPLGLHTRQVFQMQFGIDSSSSVPHSNHFITQPRRPRCRAPS